MFVVTKKIKNAKCRYAVSENLEFGVAVDCRCRRSQDSARDAFTRSWVSRAHAARGSSWPGLLDQQYFLESPRTQEYGSKTPLPGQFPSPNSLTKLTY